MRSCLNDRFKIAEKYNCFEISTDDERSISYFQEMSENNSLTEFESCSNQESEEYKLNDQYYSDRSEIVADLKFEN